MAEHVDLQQELRLGVDGCVQPLFLAIDFDLLLVDGDLNYSERNIAEKLFQTFTMRIDRFHSFWRGSPASARCWLRRFRYHYNHDRPNQALDGRTPAEEVLN